MQFGQGDLRAVLEKYPKTEFYDDEIKYAEEAVTAFMCMYYPDSYHSASVAETLDNIEGGISSCWIEQLEEAIEAAEIDERKKGYLLGALYMRGLWELQAFHGT